MTQEHPITPPPDLVDRWECEYHHSTFSPDLLVFISEKAARWGADHELEACCEWLVVGQWFAPDGECINDLRAARRPQPPSLKEEALQALYRFDDTEGHKGLTPEQIAEDFVLIRRALESLPY